MASHNRTHASDRGKVIPDLPGVPTIGTATAGGEEASVAFTSTALGGIPTSYTALSNPGSITGTGTSSPITVSGLTAGTAYTFTVRGNNATGSSEYSSASNSVTPTEAGAFYSIATTTVGAGGASSISFTSIPSTYKHLQIRLFSKAAPTATDAAYDLLTRFNGDTTIGNYGTHYVYSNGSSAGGGYTGNLGILGGATGSGNANIFDANVMDIFDYTSTNKYKTAKNFTGFEFNGSGSVILQSYLWRNTAAITSIELVFRTGPSFGQYTHAALYGIKG